MDTKLFTSQLATGEKILNYMLYESKISLTENERFTTDIVLVSSIDGFSYPFHSYILSQISPFVASFVSDNSRNETWFDERHHIIIMDSVRGVAIDTFRELIYTGKCFMSDNELYDELMSLCKTFNLVKFEVKSSGNVVHHPKVVEDTPNHKCSEPNCDMTFKRISKLRSHVQLHHSPSDTFPYYCSVCESPKKGFTNRYKMLTHERKKHNLDRTQELQDELGGGERDNDVTGDALDEKPAIRKSQRNINATKRKNMSNIECENVVMLKRKVRKKILKGKRRAKKTKEYAPLCSTTESVSNLPNVPIDSVTNDLIATGVALHSCNECGTKFKRPSHLKDHHFRHHAPKVHFSCKYCQKTFGSKYDMFKHVKNIHEQIESLKCVMCDHSASNLFNLKNHMRTHSQFKPYKCFPCDKTFSLFSNLSRHYNKFHVKRNDHVRFVRASKTPRPGVYSFIDHSSEERSLLEMTNDAPLISVTANGDVTSSTICILPSVDTVVDITAKSTSNPMPLPPISHISKRSGNPDLLYSSHVYDDMLSSPSALMIHDDSTAAWNNSHTSASTYDHQDTRGGGGGSSVLPTHVGPPTHFDGRFVETSRHHAGDEFQDLTPLMSPFAAVNMHHTHDGVGVVTADGDVLETVDGHPSSHLMFNPSSFHHQTSSSGYGHVLTAITTDRPHFDDPSTSAGGDHKQPVEGGKLVVANGNDHDQNGLGVTLDGGTGIRNVNTIICDIDDIF